MVPLPTALSMTFAVSARSLFMTEKYAYADKVVKDKRDHWNAIVGKMGGNLLAL